MRRQLLPALGMVLVFTVLTGLVYPLVVTGIAQGVFNGQGQRVADQARRQGGRLDADRPAVHRTRVLPSAPVGRRLRAGRAGWWDLLLRLQLRPDQRDASCHGEDDPDDAGRRRVRQTNRRRTTWSEAYREENGLARDAKVPVDAVTGSGQRSRPRRSRSPTPASRHRGSPRPGASTWTRCCVSSTTTPTAATSGSSASRASTCSS